MAAKKYRTAWETPKKSKKTTAAQVAAKLHDNLQTLHDRVSALERGGGFHGMDGDLSGPPTPSKAKATSDQLYAFAFTFDNRIARVERTLKMLSKDVSVLKRSSTAKSSKGKSMKK